MRELKWLNLIFQVPLLWVIAQGVSLYLYIVSTPAPSESVKRWSTELSAAAHEVLRWIRRPFTAIAEVEQLQQLNTDLLATLRELKQPQGPVDGSIGAWGTFEALRGYQLIPAQALYQTLHLRSNYLLLDKGGRDGLYPGLGVISLMGAVGIIAETTSTYSVVYSLFHRDVHIALYLPRQGAMGLSSWEGTTFNRLKLEYVPLYVPVEVGEEVWTAPNATLFPKGIRVGKVSQVRPDFTGGFYSIEVQTYTDWHRLGPLYVLRPHSPTIPPTP